LTPQSSNTSYNTVPQLNEASTWRPLKHFNYYRLTLGLGLYLFFQNALFEGMLGKYNPEAYLATVIIFILSSFIYIFLCLKKILSFETQVILATSSDIILITLLTHFSGGLGSALSILLIINIAATGTFLNSRNSFLFAALASLAILAEQTSAMLNNTTNANAYAITGILGITFFGSSILASTLSKRLRESEAFASQKEADLIKLESLNEHIIQNMRTGILVVNNNGFVRMANSSAEALLGNISLQSHPLLEEIFPALEQRFFEWLAQPQMHQKPITQNKGLPDIQPGFRKLGASSSNPEDTLIFLEDATQLNLRFQQIKLASLGRLTASIAHEIRNPLSAINHASQLLDETTQDEADKKLTQIISTQVKRLDKIVSNVLQLSRQQKNEPEEISLDAWLENFKQEFCQNHLISDNQITVLNESDNIIILFDSSHLYQVLNNLCSNAIDHSNKPKDEIIIKLISNYDKNLEQPYMDIIDNGPGISSELSQQVFDPFFTTSPKGTGLGLYLSKEILESNRATIRHIDMNTDGNCFRLHFLSTRHISQSKS
jgi:two-component system, NtrC family, sensor histidine kinase PilS